MRFMSDKQTGVYDIGNSVQVILYLDFVHNVK